MNDIIEIPEEKKDKGFTLVELLIVIVILGILATVTVFAVGGITQSARENTCSTEFATVQTAAEAYAVDNDNNYPADTAALVTANFLREEPTNGFTIDAAARTVTPDADSDCP